MDVAGLVLSACGLLYQLVDLGDRLAEDYSAFQDVDEATNSLALEMRMEKERTRALRSILVGDNSEADQKGATKPSERSLFAKLSLETQLNIISVLELFCNLLGVRYEAIKKRYQLEIDRKSQTGKELTLPRSTLSPKSPSPSSLNFGSKLRWVLWDRKKAAKLVEDYHSWNEKLFAIVQLHYHANFAMALSSYDDSGRDLNQSVMLRQSGSERQSFEILGLQNESEMLRIASSATLPNKNLEIKEPIHIMDASYHRKFGLRNGVQVCLESKGYEPNIDAMGEESPPPVVKERIQQLAALLSTTTSTRFHLLPCEGWTHDAPARQFNLIFTCPPRSNICKPLHILLGESKTKPKLDLRFKLAFALAESLYQIFSVHWVHKSLRSDNVLFFWESAEAPPDFSKPYLLGFDYSRPESGQSSRIQASCIARDIYRHPEQWGDPSEKFNKKHDIYALGVLLLEVGLWKPVITLEQNGFAKLAGRGPSVKKFLVRKAGSNQLGIEMGESYQRVVQACLNFEFGMEIDPEDRKGVLGVELLQAFRDQVLDVLERAEAGLTGNFIT